MPREFRWAVQTCTLGQMAERAEGTSCKDSGTLGASLSFGTFSGLWEPPSSARPPGLSSGGPRGFPGCSDYRCGSAGPDWTGQKRESLTHLVSLRSILQHEGWQWGCKRTGALESARATGGQEPSSRFWGQQQVAVPGTAALTNNQQHIARVHAAESQDQQRCAAGQSPGVHGGARQGKRFRLGPSPRSRARQAPPMPCPLCP